MAFGLRIREADGTIILDTTDLITRKAYVSAQSTEDGNSGALAILSGKLSAEFAVGINLAATESVHKVYRSGTTVYWENYETGGFIDKGNCVMFCFIYD